MKNVNLNIDNFQSPVSPIRNDILAHMICNHILITPAYTSYYIRQRSWANVMYSSLFVCLSVCLLAGLLKKLLTDLKILWEGSQLPKDHSIKFW